MYAISSALRRKLTGTSTRPQPLTPKNDTSSRAAFCETIATRSPRPRPRSSRAAAWARASSAMRPYVSVPSPPPGGSGSSTTPTRSGIHEPGPVQVVGGGEGYAHAPNAIRPA